MRKYIILSGLLLLLITGCSNKEADVKKDSNQLSVEDQEKAQEQAHQKAIVEFRDIDVVKVDNFVKLTGEATAENKEFFYQIEQDGVIIQEEIQVLLEKDGQEWQAFNIEKDIKGFKNKEDPLIMMFYGKDTSGKKMGQNYIPINLMNL